MKAVKRATSLLIIFSLVLGLFSWGTASADTVDSFSFDSETVWETSDPLKFNFNSFTVKAKVRFPGDYASSKRGGVIFSNYGIYGNAFCVEVQKNGNPRVLYLSAEGLTEEFLFKKVNLYTGNWIDLAITCDGSVIKCYADGVLKEKQNISLTNIFSYNSRFAVGSDYRLNNAQYFKGKIKSIALWSSVKTESQIKNDTLPTSDHGLLVSYNFNKIPSDATTVTNLLSGGTNLKKSPIWFTKKETKPDYDYTFVAIGDTQTVSYYAPDKFGMIYDYIIDNIKKQKIKFVFGLGDITEKNTLAEWDRNMPHIRKLNGVVPYSLVRGNHDGKTNYNNYVKPNTYGFDVDGTYDETALNTYRTFTVNNIKYLFLTLDYGPEDEVLEWANNVISKYPKHNVIITTHAYLFRDGSTLDISDAAQGGWVPTNDGGANNGDDIWNKLVSKHKNIVLVMSGHEPSDTVVATKTKGAGGTYVTQLLIDPQDTDRTCGVSGLVALLHFSNNGTKVSIEYYSTIRNKYYKSENQFTLNIAGMGYSDGADKKSDKEDSEDSGNSSVSKSKSNGNKTVSGSSKISKIKNRSDNSAADNGNIDSDILNETDTNNSNNAKTGSDKVGSSSSKNKSKSNPVATILSIIFVVLVLGATAFLIFYLIKSKKHKK